MAGQLAAAGLTETDGGVTRLTPPACALRAEVLAESAKVTGPLLATLDRADVETTIRTLDEITRLARRIPARRRTTEDDT